MKSVSCLVLALITLKASGAYQPYEWEKDRKPFTLSDQDKARGEIVLKQHQQYDYALESGGFIMYSAFHRIVFVNTSEAVQKNNRISISLHNTMDLVELKARAISPIGKVIYFDKSNLKELKDEESGDAYRIFAMEGVETGSEVEYYFIKKMSGAIFNRINIQSDVFIKSASFKVTIPNHLKLDFRSYNGARETVKQETTDDNGTNTYSLAVQDMPAMKEESYSYFSATLAKVEFKLAYNMAKSKARLYTWEEAGKTFYNVLYKREKDEDKALEKYVKSIDKKTGMSLDEQIAFVETKIKREFNVDPRQRSPQYANLASVLKVKIASTEGITRLFLAIFESMGINTQAVITSDRKHTRFDGKFDSWSYLDNYVIYFPDTKGFMAPYETSVRYPLIPATWASQDALFIEPVSVGEFKSGLGTVSTIPAADHSLSMDNMIINASLSANQKDCDIKIVRSFSGYDAGFILPYFDLMTDVQRQTMVEEITKQTAPDARIKEWKANVVTDKAVSKVAFDVSYQSAHFVEKAGPRILWKVGLLIGPQIEMYRDDSRMNPVENDFNRAYERQLILTIPEGYIVKNPDDLKIRVLYEDGNRVPFSFESSYTIDGNILKLTVNEYYKDIYAPLSRYEDFRKVINASADFNKVTLVLEKR